MFLLRLVGQNAAKRGNRKKFYYGFIAVVDFVFRDYNNYKKRQLFCQPGKLVFV